MLLLTACAIEAEAPDKADTDCAPRDWFYDGDGDGHGLAGSPVTQCEAPLGYVADASDCNDADPAAYPGASETCDGADDDCDGETDEDATDASFWYADTDGDGSGAGEATLACDAPAGSVASSDDCDDDDDAIFPGAEEACNELDDDCDGEADEDAVTGARDWYLDGDRDGFAGTDFIHACDGDFETASDCDDGDAAIHPGAEESCDDVDQDCDGSIDDYPVDATTWYIDADGDSFGSVATSFTLCEAPAGFVADATDCDDLDADTHPDATETCDGEDDDCNGTIDDDATDAPTWYADDDGDGHGGATSTSACDAPTGFVATNDDCDDAAADVSPSDPEVCGGSDEDCDGEIDEDDASDATVWYADADGDGWGDDAVPETACDEPAGHVADAGDCDDTNIDISPDAAEACGDGADNDCDGDADEECGPLGAYAIADAWALFTDYEMGTHAALIPDADGDGDPEIAVGHAYSDAYATDAGYVTIHGIDGSGTHVLADGSLLFGSYTDGLGWALDGGDFDNDGLGDVIIGGGYLGAGRTYVDFSPFGEGDADTEADVRIADSKGNCVSGLGDVDGDGADDFAFADKLGGAGPWVVYGPIVAGSYGSSMADVAFDVYNDRGCEVLAGDTDGDGAAELAVSDSGRAYLVDPIAIGTMTLPADAEVTFSGNDGTGNNLAMGDFDGDALQDLALGDNWSREWATFAGVVYVTSAPYAGTLDLSVRGSGTYDVAISGTAADDRLAWDDSVESAGDVDGDGVDELLLGAAGYGSFGLSMLFYGPITGDASGDKDILDADATFEASKCCTGEKVGRGGDANGDGFNDLFLVSEDYSAGIFLGGGK